MSRPSARGRLHSKPSRPSFEAQLAGLGLGLGEQRRGARASGRSSSPEIAMSSSSASAVARMTRPRPPKGRIVHEHVPESIAMPTYLSSSSDSDDEEENSDDEDVVGTSRQAKARAAKRSTAKAKARQKQKEREPEFIALPKPGGIRSGVTLTQKEMVHNSLLYFLLMQHKKHPIKRSEIIKHAMNDQGKEFPEVMRDLSTVFDRVFGMKVHGLEATKSGQFSSYMLTSDFNLSVSDIVTERDSDVDYRRSILFIILSVIFMLNRSIEEEAIWKILTELQLNEPTDPVEEEGAYNEAGGIHTHINYVTKREELARFLKKEYVSTMYLHAETETTGTAVTRYSWGKRAEKEFSKYAILKFVCKYFPGKKPCDFMDQYNIVQEQEKEAVEQDLANEERSSLDMENDREALAEALGSSFRAHHGGSPDKAAGRGGRIVPSPAPTRSLAVSLDEAETETEETPSVRGRAGAGRSLRDVREQSLGIVSVGEGQQRKRRAIIESDEESEVERTINGVTMGESPSRNTNTTTAVRATRRSAKHS